MFMQSGVLRLVGGELGSPEGLGFGVGELAAEEGEEKESRRESAKGSGPEDEKRRGR